MAVDFVRVLYRNVSTDIFLDGAIRTYSGVAEAAAVKHLGRRGAAEVPTCALSLRGPVESASKISALAALALVEDIELSALIDRARVTDGAWFLLEIESSGESRRMYAMHTNRSCNVTVSHVAVILQPFLVTLLKVLKVNLRAAPGVQGADILFPSILISGSQAPEVHMAAVPPARAQ